MNTWTKTAWTYDDINRMRRQLATIKACRTIMCLLSVYAAGFEAGVEDAMDNVGDWYDPETPEERQ